MYLRTRIAVSGLLVGVPLFGVAVVASALPQETGTSMSPTQGIPICPTFSRSLKRGLSGNDVKQLQQFLSQDPGVYPEEQVSGFFGALTESAVKRWQIKFNVVAPSGMGNSDFGLVGPKTMAAILRQCSAAPGVAATAAPSVGGFMAVSPIAGGAPLTVSIQAIVNTSNVCGGSVYDLDYGDGSIQSQIAVQSNNCQQVMKLLSHTYGTPGNYQITLSVGQHRAYASVTVYTAGYSQQVPQQPLTPSQSQDSISSMPNAGPVPLSVIFTGLINQQQLCNGGQYTISFGDGNTAGLTFDSSTCSARTFSIAHEYRIAGKYSAELHFGSSTGPLVGSVTVTAY